MQSSLGGGRQWYPYSYLFGYLMRRAEFATDEAAQLLGMTADQSAQSAPLGFIKHV